MLSRCRITVFGVGIFARVGDNYSVGTDQRDAKLTGGFAQVQHRFLGDCRIGIGCKESARLGFNQPGNVGQAVDLCVTVELFQGPGRKQADRDRAEKNHTKENQEDAPGKMML